MSYHVEETNFRELPERITVLEDGYMDAYKNYGEPIVEYVYVPAGGVECELDYVEDKSQWFKLFGTPERAAEYFAMQCLNSDSSMCCYCPFDDCDERLRNMGAYPSVYNKILDWLGGDAE